MTMTTTMSSDRVGGVRRGTSEALFMGRASPSASRAPWWPDAQHLRVAHLQISSATHGTVSGFHFRGGAGATSFGSTSALEGGKDDELLTRDRELTRKTGPKRDSSSQGGRDGLAKELKLQFWQGVTCAQSRFKLLRCDLPGQNASVPSQYTDLASAATLSSLTNGPLSGCTAREQGESVHRRRSKDMNDGTGHRGGGDFDQAAVLPQHKSPLSLLGLAKREEKRREALVAAGEDARADTGRRSSSAASDTRTPLLPSDLPLVPTLQQVPSHARPSLPSPVCARPSPVESLVSSSSLPSALSMALSTRSDPNPSAANQLWLVQPLELVIFMAGVFTTTSPPSSLQASTVSTDHSLPATAYMNPFLFPGVKARIQQESSRTAWHRHQQQRLLNPLCLPSSFTVGDLVAAPSTDYQFRLVRPLKFLVSMANVITTIFATIAMDIDIDIYASIASSLAALLVRTPTRVAAGSVSSMSSASLHSAARTTTSPTGRELARSPAPSTVRLWDLRPTDQWYASHGDHPSNESGPPNPYARFTLSRMTGTLNSTVQATNQGAVDPARTSSSPTLKSAVTSGASGTGAAASGFSVALGGANAAAVAMGTSMLLAFFGVSLVV
ncbi:hypothetical protein V8E36_003341 [Tilletia maclaganii]